MYHGLRITSVVNGLEQNMRLVLFIVSILIAYGSLFPFQFVMTDFQGTDILSWLFTFNQRTTRGDILGNILLFLPLGFFGALGIASYERTKRHWLTFLLIGVGVFYAILLQALQLFLPSRIASSLDAVANLIGLLLGIVVVKIMATKKVSQWYSSEQVSLKISIPVMLCACWLGFHWFPFIPSLTWAQIEFSLRPLYHWHLLSPFLLADKFIAWSLFWFFIDKAFPFPILNRYRWGLLLLILFFQLVFVRNLMDLNVLFAAILSIIFINQVRRIRIDYCVVILLVWLFARGWYPFALSDNVQDFNLTPFSIFLSGSMWMNSYLLFENLFCYGAFCYFCFIWLRDWGWVALISFFSLLIIEFGQMWFIHDTAELTDPLIILFLSYGFSQLILSHPSSSKTIVTSV